MDRRGERLGEILVRRGLINNKQLNDTLNEQQRTKEFLGLILIRRDRIKEKDLLEVLSEQFNIPFISIKYKYIDWDFVRKFSPSLILDYKCFPVRKDDWSMTIAITNPLDAWVLKKAEEETRPFKLKLILVSEEDMKGAIRRYKEYMC